MDSPNSPVPADVSPAPQTASLTFPPHSTDLVPPSLPSFPSLSLSPDDLTPPILTFRRSPTLPPQLDALQLPPSTFEFGASLVDLLTPLEGLSAQTTRLRQRTVSRLSMGPGSGGAAGARQRRRSTMVRLTEEDLPGLAPGRPSGLGLSRLPARKDERVKEPGEEEEEVWTAPFPEEGEGLDEWVDGKEVEEWSEEGWEKVEEYLKERGYALDKGKGEVNPPRQATF
ncbi:hypothetical protein JCM8547_005076 [Rhodosporidiobolus lusitaniae]